MYEVDFLAVENEENPSSKSGDAITLHFDVDNGRTAVVVIDAGFTAVGQQVVDHIASFYGKTNVDLIISTHPDTDHLNGLVTVLEECTVGELIMHLPWNHDSRSDLLGNYERIVEVYDLAIQKGVTVTEPSAGLQRFGGRITILGPTTRYYDELLNEAINAELTTSAGERAYSSVGSVLLATGTKLLERVRSFFPIETLSNADETSARNKSSVITLLTVDGKRMLFTGDAGIPSLEAAADVYQSLHGSFASAPLALFQGPHHGSHRNVGPDILDRILGPEGSHFAAVNAVISSAKASEKHPSPKVTNALGRRGAAVVATEGRGISYTSVTRPGWYPCTPLAPLEEDA